MKKQRTEYTWNEDLQRVLKGELHQTIEAQQHDKAQQRGGGNFLIDDTSQVLREGYRRSDAYIEREIQRERDLRKSQREYQEKQIARQHAPDEYHEEQYPDLPLNQNQATPGEYWYFGQGGFATVFGIIALIATALVAYFIQP